MARLQLPTSLVNSHDVWVWMHIASKANGIVNLGNQTNISKGNARATTISRSTENVQALFVGTKARGDMVLGIGLPGIWVGGVVALGTHVL